jgi:hypothetical protein
MSVNPSIDPSFNLDIRNTNNISNTNFDKCIYDYHSNNYQKLFNFIKLHLASQKIIHYWDYDVLLKRSGFNMNNEERKRQTYCLFLKFICKDKCYCSKTLMPSGLCRECSSAKNYIGQYLCMMCRYPIDKTYKEDDECAIKNFSYRETKTVSFKKTKNSKFNTNFYVCKNCYECDYECPRCSETISITTFIKGHSKAVCDRFYIKKLEEEISNAKSKAYANDEYIDLKSKHDDLIIEFKDLDNKYDILTEELTKTQDVWCRTETCYLNEQEKNKNLNAENEALKTEIEALKALKISD